MRFKSFIVTLAGIAIAGGSVFLAKENLLDARGAAIAAQQSVPEIEMVEVVVAGTNIEFGNAIERHMLTVQNWPKEAVPGGVFKSYSDIVGTAESGARRARTRMYQGELMLAVKLSDFGEKVTLVQKLGKNTRAVAIKVDAVTAVGGFVTPGDSVDIVLTQGRGDQLSAVTILQNIKVIGVDQQSEESNEQVEVARTITVEVTPKQGQKLALAQRAGTLSLTLRTLDGVLDEPIEMVQLSDILHDKVVDEEEVFIPSVKVRRGVDVQTVNVD